MPAAPESVSGNGKPPHADAANEFDTAVADMNRIAVLVDVNTLFFTAKSVYQGKVDYAALMKAGVADRMGIRANAYVLQRPDVNQRCFLEALEQAGLQAKVKEIKVWIGAGGRESCSKASWATGITVDAMNIAPRVGTVVLVTEDASLLPLVETLKSLGRRVEVAGFRSAHNEMATAADRFIAIDGLVFKDRKFVNAPSGRGGLYEGLPQDDDLEAEEAAAARKSQRALDK